MNHIPTVSPKARHNPAGKPVPHHAAKPARGNMKPAEIKPLVMAARKAFDFQLGLGNIDAGTTFDAWRHQECMTAVRRPGITSCCHEDYRPLLAHFQHLYGDDGEAFASSMKGGKPTDNAAPGDTHEARRHRAHLIAELLEGHHFIADHSLDQLIATEAQVWYNEHPHEPYPGAGADWTAATQSRKDSIAFKGRIDVGYVVYLVRAKTRRPDLQLGRDWEAGLAERCTRQQLDQIFYTIQNRINAVEGVGSTRQRNRKQKSPAAKAARDPGQMSAPRW